MPPPSLNGPIITVQVGPEDEENSQSNRETFYVHENAICDASPYFANAMKPEWSNLRPDPRTIILPDDDADAFELYLSFLYSRQLPILTPFPPKDPSSTMPNPNAPGPALPSTSTATSSSSNWEPQSDGYHTLAYAYVLGDRLLDTAFKNAIVDAYVLYARGTQPAKRYYPSNEEIRILYEGTREDAPIRKLLVDIWTARGKSEWLDADMDLPGEFLAEVTRGLLRAREKRDGGVGGGIGGIGGSGGVVIGAGTEGVSRPWKMSHEQYYEK